MELWEVLVPTVRNDGRPIHTRFHKVWDNQVRTISGGLTVMPVAKGQWENGGGILFAERMIPVRISCTREQIIRILKFTVEYYAQEAIMAYLISDTVIIMER